MAFVEHLLKLQQRILQRRSQQLFKDRSDVVLFHLEQAVYNIIDNFSIKAALNADILICMDICWRDRVKLRKLHPRI